MTKTLLVRMVIPICTKPIVPVSSLTFSKWLPVKEKDFLCIGKGNMKLTFWFEPSSAGRSSAKELSSWTNVTPHSINADVLIAGIPNALVDYIIKSSSMSGLPKIKQNTKYESLGKEVYMFTMEHYNRLISYVRSYKGQYWLEDYDIDVGNMSSAFAKFTSKVQIVGNKKWFRWMPNKTSFLTIVSMDDDRYVTRMDWKEAGKFVCSNERVPLVLDLLAKAEMYSGQEQNRPALTEAVCALEIAVFSFAEYPNAQAAFGSKLATRMKSATLANQINHMGLSGTINYLFPVIFNEKKVSTILLNTCQDAIYERGNVVHNKKGQRDVPKKRLDKYLSAIRELCEILNEFS